MIIETLNQDQFVNKFLSIRPDNFSYEGLQSLFTYFEDFSCDTNEHIEFDPIAICCEYTEYKNLQEIIDTYDCINCEDDLYDYTTPIFMADGDRIIILDF
jgi:hypothetical protein